MSAESESSRLPKSNSVNSATAGNQGSDEKGYQDRVVERATEVVEEFARQYPERARLPISQTPGRRVRSELVEEEWVEEHVEGAEGEGSGFTTARLERAEPVTWADCVFEFLVSRQRYDDGTFGEFRDVETDERFNLKFSDCWTTEYGDEQAAKNMGAQRQLMGGVYPDDEDSARSGETVDGVWSDDVATVLLTRTGTSTPDGERLPPVDHADAVVRTWSEGGVYDTVRNVCEYHLGLESDEWGYVRGDDVHGAGAADGDGNPGANACYLHAHDGIYLDIGATDLRDTCGSDEEIRSTLQMLFYKAIEKHLESCEFAKPEAHQPDDACEVMLDLVEPASYATGYLRLDEDEEMMDRSVEFQAFAAVEWATARQRIARSQLFTDAATADMCKQSPDQVHGSTVIRDRSGHGDSEIVCAHCESGVGIDADTLVESRMSEPSCDDAVAADGGQVVVGAAVGESPQRARIRSQIEDYIDRVGEPESMSVMLGELGLPPTPAREIAAEVVAGRDSSGLELIMGDPLDVREYELEQVIDPSGEEEASPGGGGVEMTELVLPEERLLRETRLRYHTDAGGDAGSPKIYVETGDGRELATGEPEIAAGWLVHYGYRRPWHAEMALTFTNRGDGVADAFEEPVAEPPEAVK